MTEGICPGPERLAPGRCRKCATGNKLPPAHPGDPVEHRPEVPCQIVAGVAEPVTNVSSLTRREGMALVRCKECEKQVSDQATACPHCGAPVRRVSEPPPPTTPSIERAGSAGNVVAGVASFFVPGLGQLVQGRIGPGVLHFALAVGLWFVLLGWIVHLASAVEAARYTPQSRAPSRGKPPEPQKRSAELDFLKIDRDGPQ